MFDKDKVFYGKHADYLNFLCKDKRSINPEGLNLFETKIELYTLAPIIGMIHGIKSEIDRSTDSKSTILLQQIKTYEDDLIYVYRMIILLHDKDNLSYEERINRAFRSDNDEELKNQNMEIFDEYALGGIEYLYETFKDDFGNTDAKRENLIMDLFELLEFEDQNLEEEPLFY